ncbi:MAG: cytochrome c oxidase assembly protein [Pseudomonadota bacterium]
MTAQSDQAKANSKVVWRCVAVLALMTAMTVAAVPLYDWFCRVTGYGGTTNVASAPSGVVLEETITIRFDASRAAGMEWEFRPVETSMEIQIGMTGLAFYEAYNPTDRPIAGSASFNVTPFDAGAYFSKIQCFCFEEQVLQPGERVMMPVSFFIDPELTEDPETIGTPAITLSYTFHEIDLPEDDQQAALSRVAD